MPRLPIYLEVASKRTFAGVVDWPGAERSGRDEAAAIEALVAALPRYERALGRVAASLSIPRSTDDVEVIERRGGGSGTEFGVPSHGASADERPVDEEELGRLIAILRAAWAAVDRAAEQAEGVELRKGPRGGGRELDRIVEHVLGAEEAYLREIGGRPKGLPADRVARMAAVREASIAALAERARGVEVEMGRRQRPWWTPRYFVRRSGWHALDHAWEIEDRAAPDG
jgi:hypothetical protein